MERDPVCGKELDLEDIQFQSFHEGKMFSFDSYECKKMFDAGPEKYSTYFASATAVEAGAAEGAGAAYGAGEKVKEIGKKVSARSKSRAKSIFSERKGEVADFLDGISDALHGTSQRLMDQKHERTAHLSDGAAEEVERLSGFLRRDVDDVITGAEDYVRKSPGLAMCGMFAAGFLAARFLKSSGLEKEEAAH